LHIFRGEEDCLDDTDDVVGSLWGAIEAEFLARDLIVGSVLLDADLDGVVAGGIGDAGDDSCHIPCHYPNGPFRDRRGNEAIATWNSG
jgi:hypothetical protein